MSLISSHRHRSKSASGICLQAAVALPLALTPVICARKITFVVWVLRLGLTGVQGIIGRGQGHTSVFEAMGLRRIYMSTSLYVLVSTPLAAMQVYFKSSRISHSRTSNGEQDCPRNAL